MSTDEEEEENGFTSSAYKPEFMCDKVRGYTLFRTTTLRWRRSKKITKPIVSMRGGLRGMNRICQKNLPTADRLKEVERHIGSGHRSVAGKEGGGDLHKHKDPGKNLVEGSPGRKFRLTRRSWQLCVRAST